VVVNRERTDMHVVIAPIRLKPDITQEMLLAASDDFDRRFVKTQDGIIRRMLVKGAYPADYADIVYFADQDAIERVIEAERTSEVCAAFFSIMEGDDNYHVYEVIRTYE
jgi:hypothetical protein